MKHWLAVFLIFSACVSARADLPAKGASAPALSYTQLLQAPAGAKVDWRSLHGKVVVLEFWATWCVPCIAEIPVLNNLSASLDPSKVQIISVDDEDPKVVGPFLKKHPISGWIMLDTTANLYKRYGVESRPTTIVVDPRGRVVSTDIRPDHLQRDQLLALAELKPVKLEGKADAKTEAEVNARIQKGFDEETRKNEGATNALFDIAITPGDASGKPHFIMGEDRFDISNGSLNTLLQYGAKIPSSRFQKQGTVPDGPYNLHVKAPGADPKLLAQAIEMAIASAAGVRIESHTAVEDVYLLQAVDKSKGILNAESSTHGGAAEYDEKTQQLFLLRAGADQIAGALEAAVGSPVLNQDNIQGQVKMMMTIHLPAHDVEAAKAVLEKNLGLTLVPSKQPVERWIISAAEKKSETAAPASAAK